MNEWRNPWAPATGDYADDDSSELSTSHSQPIEPGVVVQSAPLTVPTVTPIEPPPTHADDQVTIPPEPEPEPAPNPFAPPQPAPPATVSPRQSSPIPVIPTPTATAPVSSLASPNVVQTPTPALTVVRLPAPPPPSDVAISASITNTVDREDLDRTVLTRETKVAWTLRSIYGDSAEFSSVLVVVGRNPVPHQRAAGAQLVALNDPTRTMSKTHALLEYIAESWFITDLGSTNGVILIDNSNIHKNLESGERARVAGRLLLGDLEMTIEAVEGK